MQVPGHQQQRYWLSVPGFNKFIGLKLRHGLNLLGAIHNFQCSFMRILTEVDVSNTLQLKRCQCYPRAIYTKSCELWIKVNHTRITKNPSLSSERRSMQNAKFAKCDTNTIFLRTNEFVPRGHGLVTRDLTSSKKFPSLRVRKFSWVTNNANIIISACSKYCMQYEYWQIIRGFSINKAG